MRGCVNLGLLLSAGIGGAQDLARARAVYEQACKAGHGQSCQRLRRLQSVEKSQQRR